MGDVLAFWLAALATGALALPIAFAFFRRFPDAGAGLSFILGLVLASFCYFILRTFDVLEVGRGGFVVALALLALIGFVVAARDSRFVSTFRRSLPGMLLAATIFSVAFFGYAVFRSYTSSIGGTEQPMDFLYLNAALTSPDYPPQDPWLAGQPAAYYYFGYVQAAYLTGVSGVPASTGYNLALAAVFASSAAAVVSVAAAVARWLVPSVRRLAVPIAGTVALVVLLFAGSLIGSFEFAAAHGADARGLYGDFGVDNILPCEPGQTGDCYAGPTDPRTDTWYPTEFWFWWRGSRVIDGTITEFPFFSFLLGDLHPHLMAMPLVLLAIGLASAAWRGRRSFSHRTLVRRPWESLAVAVILGALAFQNAWDVVTFAGLFALAVGLSNFRRSPPRFAATATLGYLAPIGAAAVILYLPWLLDFDSQAGGIFPYAGKGTPPGEAILQYGVPLTAGAVVLAWALYRLPLHDLSRASIYGLWVPILPLLLWAPLAAYHGDLSTGVDARGAGGYVTLAGLALLCWALATAAIAARRHHDAVVVAAGVALAGVLLLYGAELFYVRDVFAGSVPRLNTVFKLSYQAWILLAVAGGAGAAAVVAAARRNSLLAYSVATPAAIVLALSLVYAVIAVPNRTDGFDAQSSIDGLASLARDNPSEYALARWVRANVPASDIVVEATGRRWASQDGAPTLVDANVDYGDGGRISSRTGRPTPIGWYFHEIQWRGDTAANQDEFRSRQDMVDDIYLASDPADALAGLDDLGAAYVVVGPVERARYPSALMPDFDSFLDLAFQTSDGQASVYRVPVDWTMTTS